jgi:hypothetical protein
MKFTVQAYTIHVGDILADGRKVTAVTTGPGTFHTAITTEDGKTYVLPNRQMVGIK